MDRQSKNPRVFISYSWTSEEYADRVEELARALTADGIEIVLDQWDLKAGHDKHLFMEQSVVDPTINRVLILIDPRYVERANAREGGVGTETTIISGEVYARADQQKFIPVLMDRGDAVEGEPRLPAYLASRIYIDLSDPERYESEYERLIRDIYEKPLRERPLLGKRPEYLDDDAVRLTTGRSLAMFKQAVLNERTNQAGFLRSYLERVADAYAAEIINEAANTVELEEQVIASLAQFLPYRDEFVDFLQFMGQFGSRADLYDQLHEFFERLVRTQREHRPLKWSDEIETENLGFLGWELFLYTIGILLRARKFEGVARLVEPYYVTSWNGNGALRSFCVIDPGFRLIDDQRNKRLELRKLSLSAAIARERMPSGFDFDILMEADSLLLVCYLISSKRPQEYGSWWPRTLVYLGHRSLADLPLWSRVRNDDSYFTKLSPVLQVRDRSEAATRLVAEGPYLHIEFTKIGKQHVAHALGLPGS